MILPSWSILVTSKVYFASKAWRDIKTAFVDNNLTEREIIAFMNESEGYKDIAKTVTGYLLELKEREQADQEEMLALFENKAAVFQYCAFKLSTVTGLLNKFTVEEFTKEERN